MTTEGQIVHGMGTAALLVLIAGTLVLMTGQQVDLGVFLVGWAVTVFLLARWMDR